jgi:hypothetical protein
MYATDTAGMTFASPGVYSVQITVTDDDGGSASATYAVVITGGWADAEGQGFWRHQFGDKGKRQIQDAALLAYLDIVDYVSDAFSFSDEPGQARLEARNLFQPGGADVGDPHPSNMKGKATQQALAAWLNFACGAVGWNEPAPTGQLFSTSMQQIDDILLDLDGDMDHQDYVLAMEMAAAINERDR